MALGGFLYVPFGVLFGCVFVCAFCVFWGATCLWGYGFRAKGMGLWVCGFWIGCQRIGALDRLPENWCRRRDLNPRPLLYESIALPAELLRLGWVGLGIDLCIDLGLTNCLTH